MRLRTSTERWTGMLLASLGVAPLGGCGGVTLPTTSGGAAGEETGGTTVVGSGGQAGTYGPGGSYPGGSAGTSGTYGTGGTYGSGGGYGTGGSYGPGGSYGTGGIVSTGTGGGAGSGGSSFPCVNPRPLVSAPSGYFQCASGYIHRAEKVDCPVRVRSVVDAGRVDASSDADASVGECRTDGDCMARAHGYCVPSSGPFGSGSYCSYGCIRDQECAAGLICLCGDPVGQCVPSACTSDQSCAGGAFCASYAVNPGCGGIAFSCQTPKDQCGGDADCGAGNSCIFQSGVRVCSPPRCVIGRPFLVDGVARVAHIDGGGDWTARDLAPRADAVPPALRERLGEAWTQIALLEHASIAAFARFTLQLLSLGAPAELIERSQGAMADETAHAKLAFGLAGAFGGRDVGPSVLDVRGALDQNSLVDILSTAIREGCIGETVAALEAAEALEYARDPVVRDVLARIARDETRHAELAWRFVRWAVACGGEQVRQLAWRAFQAALAEEPKSTAAQALTSDEKQLLANGIVPASLRNVIRNEAMGNVVLPCAQALLAPAEVPTAANAA